MRLAPIHFKEKVTFNSKMQALEPAWERLARQIEKPITLGLAADRLL
jgi:hypothetical protein